MMELSYYPGCALEGTAAEYDESIRAICNALGIKIAELPDWSCCGASSAHVTSDQLAVELAARNLQIADKIRLANQETIAAGYVESQARGCAVKLIGLDDEYWFALAIVGSWTVETS